MKNKEIILYCLLISIISCDDKLRKNDIERKNFHIPIISQEKTEDSMYYYNFHKMESSTIKFYCKSKFTDTVFICEHINEEEVSFSDISQGYSNTVENDTFTTDGFQIFPDYQTTVYNRYNFMKNGAYYFPVYVVNETSRTKMLCNIDGFQEAMITDEYSRWEPIETRRFQMCGSTNDGLKIYPGEFAILLVPKYAGDVEGKMRLKLEIGNTVYVSKTYVGKYNNSQFKNN